MKQIVQKVFAVACLENFVQRRLAYIAIYLRRVGANWRYCVAVTGNRQTLLDGFFGLEAFRSVHGNVKWAISWDEALRWLDKHDWHRGHPIFCVEDYPDRVWEAFQERHLKIPETWRKRLQIPPRPMAAAPASG